jgi:hypothetical protein
VGLDDIFPADAGARIEIEHQPVGVLQTVDGRAAHVNLQHTGLRQRHHAVDAVERDRLVAVVGYELEMLGVDAGGSVLLEKALP